MTRNTSNPLNGDAIDFSYDLDTIRLCHSEQ